MGALLFSGQYARLAGLGSFFGAYDELSLAHPLDFVCRIDRFGIIPAVHRSPKGKKFLRLVVLWCHPFPVALIMALRIKPSFRKFPRQLR